MGEDLARGEDLVFDDRLSRRTTVLFAGHIVHHRRRYACTVRDISAGGCRADTDTEFEPGTPVHLEIARLGRFPAVIAWVEGRSVGLAFAQAVGQTLAQLGPSAKALGLVESRDSDPNRVAMIGERR